MVESFFTFYGKDCQIVEDVFRGYHEPTVKEAIKVIGIGDTIKVGNVIWQVLHRQWVISNGSWELRHVELQYSDENEPDDNVDEEDDKNDDYTAEDLIDHASK